MRARIQWEHGVDVYAANNAKFGEAGYVTFTSIRMHPRQEMTFHGDEGVLRLPAPFNPRVFGEARLELRRGMETIIERWPASRDPARMVPFGPLTSRLQHIQPGDEIIVGRKPTGTLLVDYLLPAKRLHLVATGTGLARS